jgi:hypothetical protein
MIRFKPFRKLRRFFYTLLRDICLGILLPMKLAAPPNYVKKFSSVTPPQIRPQTSLEPSFFPLHLPHMQLRLLHLEYNHLIGLSHIGSTGIPVVCPNLIHAKPLIVIQIQWYPLKQSVNIKYPVTPTFNHFYSVIKIIQYFIPIVI